MVGSGLLAAALLVGLGVPRSRSPAPGLHSWVAGSLLGTVDPSPGTAALAVAVVLIGVVAGIASRRRIGPGLAVLAASGAVGGGVVLPAGASPAVLAVPLTAMVAGMVALTAM